jgi:hypothetical protein
MAAVIGNDILDIGSRKGRRQRGTPMAPELAMGIPGQFDLPNVSDVRLCLIPYLSEFILCFSRFHLTFSFASLTYLKTYSLPRTAAVTLLLFVEQEMKIRLSSS